MEKLNNLKTKRIHCDSIAIKSTWARDRKAVMVHRHLARLLPAHHLSG
jgi:hypothetical protein